MSFVNPSKVCDISTRHSQRVRYRSNTCFGFGFGLRDLGLRGNNDMGKDKKKKGSKANVFKVAGAKSLKKTKAKPVNLGLKNIKQKVAEIDKQLVEIKSDPKKNSTEKEQITVPEKKPDRRVTKEELAKTTDEMVKMDL